MVNTPCFMCVPCTGAKSCKKNRKPKKMPKPQSCPQACTHQTTALLNAQKARLSRNLKRLKKRFQKRIEEREKKLKKRLKRRLKSRERKLRRNIEEQMEKLLRRQEMNGCAEALFERYGGRTVRIQTVTGEAITGTIGEPLSPGLVQIRTADGMIAVPCSSISSIALVT